MPIAKRVFAALVSGDPAELASLPNDMLTAVFGDVFRAVDAHAAQMSRMEGKLDLSLEQDFDRDFEAARKAMLDASQTRDPAKAAGDLDAAWEGLRRAEAGTKDLLSKADAPLLAALVAL